MFLHTIEIELISSSLRTRIRPLLQNTAIPNEGIILQLNIVVAEKAERNRKLASSVKMRAKVSGST